MKISNLRKQVFKLAKDNNFCIKYHKYWYKDGGFFTLTPFSPVSSSRTFVDYGRVTAKQIVRYILATKESNNA